MIFRKVCQIFGVVLIVLGIWCACLEIEAILEGRIGIRWGLVFVAINLFVLSGIGTLFLCFDPHKVIQSHWISVFRLVDPAQQGDSFASRIGASDEKTFAEKIGVGEDD
ncbi:MAG: hypothetical protein ACI87E_003609 [Mariniblastus sp.]|jgi:hypothetical protein